VAGFARQRAQRIGLEDVDGAAEKRRAALQRRYQEEMDRSSRLKLAAAEKRLDAFREELRILRRHTTQPVSQVSESEGLLFAGMRAPVIDTQRSSDRGNLAKALERRLEHFLHTLQKQQADYELPAPAPPRPRSAKCEGEVTARPQEARPSSTRPANRSQESHSVAESALQPEESARRQHVRPLSARPKNARPPLQQTRPSSARPANRFRSGGGQAPGRAEEKPQFCHPLAESSQQAAPHAASRAADLPPEARPTEPSLASARAPADADAHVREHGTSRQSEPAALMARPPDRPRASAPRPVAGKGARELGAAQPRVPRLTLSQQVDGAVHAWAAANRTSRPGLGLTQAVIEALTARAQQPAPQNAPSITTVGNATRQVAMASSTRRLGGQARPATPRLRTSYLALQSDGRATHPPAPPARDAAHRLALLRSKGG